MPISFVKQQAMNTMAGKGSRDNIALNKICFRAVNKYINSKEESASILESIRKEGLIEPITVNEISVFLKSDDIDLLPENEKEYYERMQKKGFEYFITTGHRRFRAYCCLAVGYNEFPDDPFEFYKDFEPINEASLNALLDGNPEKSNKYCSIKCFVAKDNVKSERDRYNSSNLETRRIQDFEIVDNIIDLLKTSGQWDRIIKENKEKRINLMSDRTVRDNVQKLSLGQYKTMEEARAMLMDLPAERLTGYNTDLNNSIVDYILTTKSKKISQSSVNFARKILETFDQEMVGFIYAGKLEYKKAVSMLNYLPRVSEENLAKLKETIRAGKFNFRTAERDFASDLVETPEKQSKRTLSKKEIKKLIHKVKEGKITLDELISMIDD